MKWYRVNWNFEHISELKKRGKQLPTKRKDTYLKLVDESEVYHNKMMNHVDGSNDLKSKTDKAHNKFVETKETLRNIQKDNKLTYLRKSNLIVAGPRAS